MRFSATRSPGRVFAGSTSQDHPIVVRLDARRRKVADLLFGWESSTCKPDDIYLNADESFGDFPLAGGHFGDAFDTGYTPDEGGDGQGQLRHHRARRAHAGERHGPGQPHRDRPCGRGDRRVRQRDRAVGGRQRMSCSRAPATIAPARRSSDGVSILQRCR